jgi:hypothetical protein
MRAPDLVAFSVGPNPCSFSPIPEVQRTPTPKAAKLEALSLPVVIPASQCRAAVHDNRAVAGSQTRLEAPLDLRAMRDGERASGSPHCGLRRRAKLGSRSGFAAQTLGGIIETDT